MLWTAVFSRSFAFLPFPKSCPPWWERELRVPRGLLSPHGVRAFGLPETPKLGEGGSGERAELPLVLWLAAGLKLRVLLPCHRSLEPRDLLSPANLDG